jgi:hypothetical protein
VRLPPIPSDAALAAFFSGSWPPVRSSRGDADVRFRVGDEEHAGSVTWGYAAPDRLRIDVRDPFNRQIGLLLIRGEDLIQYPADLPLMDHLAACALMAELGGAEGVSPAAAIAAMLAGMPMPGYRFLPRVWVAAGRGDEEIADDAGGNRLAMTMTPFGPAVAAVLFTSAHSGRSITLRYGSFQPDRAGHPRRMVMTMASGSPWELELRGIRLETDVTVDEELFLLPAPGPAE